MKLSKEGRQALDVIRAKTLSGQYDFDRMQVQCLALVFEEIQLLATGKKRTLDISCHSCIKTAANTVNNYITLHEPYEEPEAPATVERKTVQESVEDRFDLTKMTVKELKAICDEQGIEYHHKSGEKKLISLILDKQAAE